MLLLCGRLILIVPYRVEEWLFIGMKSIDSLQTYAKSTYTCKQFNNVHTIYILLV